MRRLILFAAILVTMTGCQTTKKITMQPDYAYIALPLEKGTDKMVHSFALEMHSDGPPVYMIWPDGSAVFESEKNNPRERTQRNNNRSPRSERRVRYD